MPDGDLTTLCPSARRHVPLWIAVHRLVNEDLAMSIEACLTISLGLNARSNACQTRSVGKVLGHLVLILGGSAIGPDGYFIHGPITPF